MANTLLTDSVITRKSLMILENNTKAIPQCSRDAEEQFGRPGAKIGDTLFQRKPPRFIGRDGQAYQPEALTDTQVPIVVNQQSGVDFQFGSAEKYLSLDEFKTRYLKPAMVSLANKLDYRTLTTMLLNTPNFVGTPGTTPGLSGTDAFLIFSKAKQKIMEMGFPMDDELAALITPAMETGWNVYSKAFFNPSGELSKQWKTGQISNALSLKWFVDQNVNSQVIGALGGTPAVSGANQTGTALNLSGMTASIANAFLAGDIISIAGVYAVNPQNRTSTGSLQQFVVQANASSDGAGLITLALSPAITPSGQFQNVDSVPANGALINVYDTAAAGQSALAGVNTSQAIVCHKTAFAFVAIPLDVPGGVDMAFEDGSEETGNRLRFVRQYIGASDQWINRFDSAYGISPQYPEGSCRVSG